jgi:hypothetical protein
MTAEVAKATEALDFQSVTLTFRDETSKTISIYEYERLYLIQPPVLGEYGEQLTLF